MLSEPCFYFAFVVACLSLTVCLLTCKCCFAWAWLSCAVVDPTLYATGKPCRSCLQQANPRAHCTVHVPECGAQAGRRGPWMLLPPITPRLLLHNLSYPTYARLHCSGCPHRILQIGLTTTLKTQEDDLGRHTVNYIVRRLTQHVTAVATFCHFVESGHPHQRR